jgi:hypothetical protein
MKKRITSIFRQFIALRCSVLTKIPKAGAIACVLLLASSVTFGQNPVPVQGALDTPQPSPLLSPDQLDNLVAPVALYPDPLLSQVLVASTYPLEIVEVQQWLEQNRNLQGTQLVDAAKQQNWDPSVQALVAFPDALSLLSNDIRWTTDLGNAFLAQQADVMSAMQRMRARAKANGRLGSTPEQVVTTDTQGGQSAIEIQPTDPQVIYVPVYQPEYVWGPPVWGAYPSLWYPPGFGFGYGFQSGISIGRFFPGWGGRGGWGWGYGWFGNGLFVNTGFLNRYGFRGGFGGGIGGRVSGGRSAWAHDPGHRLGVPYANQAVASRFNSSRFNGNGRNGGQFSGGNRAAMNGYGGSYRQASSYYGGRSAPQGYQAPSQSSRAYNAAPSLRSAPSYNRAFAPAYSAPHVQNYSGPRSYSAPRQSFSAPHSSGGGFSGARSGFSGGRSGSSGRHSGGRSGGRR